MTTWFCEKCSNNVATNFCEDCGAEPPTLPSATADAGRSAVHPMPREPTREPSTSLASSVRASLAAAGTSGRPAPVANEPAAKASPRATTSREAPPVDTATPEQLARYEQALREFAADGVLEQWELDELEQLRVELGVSHATHDRLQATVKLKSQATVRLAMAIDELSIREFVAGQHGVVHWRVDNLEERPVRNVRVLHGVDGKTGLDQIEIRVLKPKGREDFRLQHHLDTPGQFLLSAAIECETMKGEKFHFRAETIQFRVGAASQAPSTQVYNIDAKNAVAAMDIQAAAPAKTEQTGGIMGRDSWREVRLSPSSPADFDVWVERMEGRSATSVSKSQPPAAPRAEPAVWKGDMKAVRIEGPGPSAMAPAVRTVRIEVGGVATEVLVATKNPLSFGRDPRVADVLLAVEPYDPPETFADNILKTRRFSSQHLSLALSGPNAEFTHLGRSPTTFRGEAQVHGTLALSTTPTELVLGRDVQLPQGALTVRVRAVTDMNGLTTGVVMERVTNVPERRYVLVRGVVPLTAVVPALETVPGGGGLYLAMKEEHSLVVNGGHTSFQSSVGVMTNLCAAVLLPELTINGVGWKLSVA